MTIHYSRADVPDIDRWAHEDWWDPEIYRDYFESFLEKGPVGLAQLALSPHAAPDLHSDEYSAALLHALALALLDEASPF